MSDETDDMNNTDFTLNYNPTSSFESILRLYRDDSSFAQDRIREIVQRGQEKQGIVAPLMPKPQPMAYSWRAMVATLQDDKQSVNERNRILSHFLKTLSDQDRNNFFEFADFCLSDPPGEEKTAPAR